MKVNPRRFAVCFECLTNKGDNEELENAYTIQWLREIKFSHSRSCFANRAPLPIYICEKCGSENYG